MKVTLRSKSDYRQTIWRNLLTSLIYFEAIRTTKNQAKQLVMFANHFFNQVKSTDLNARRLASQTLFGPLAVKKVFEELLPRFQPTTTTFVRSLSLGRRLGDNAQIALVSFLPASSTSAIAPVDSKNRPLRKLASAKRAKRLVKSEKNDTQ